MTTPSTPADRAPAAWIHAALRIAPAHIPIGHSLRAGLTVGLPFVVGALLGQTMTGMWVGLATLLLAAGEREGSYRLNFSIIAISTPIAAGGYLLGFLQDLPLPALVLLAAVVAFAAGAIAGLGPAFSVAGMQFLLVSSIALGVPHVDWWTAIGLYFVGGAFYALLLWIEMLVVPRRPQRLVLVSLLEALSELAAARVADLADGGSRTVEARRQATSAYQNAVGRVSELAARPSWSTRVWVMDGEVLSAAERVQAFLVAASDPVEVEAAESRLTDLTSAVSATARPHRRGTRPAKSPAAGLPPAGMLGKRIDELDRLLHSGSPTKAPHEPLVTVALGHEVMMAACRLSLCFAIAVGAKMYFPYSHWFWVPLTVCLVMKPDFGSVFSRTVLRILGTVVGAVIATVVLLVVPKGWAIGLVIGLLAACVPYLMMRSYALQAAAIAPAVILLVDVIQPETSSANFSIERIGGTIVGGAVVLVFGYLIWPHSRRVWISGTFATAMNRIADHLQLASGRIPDDPREARQRHDDLVVARRAAYRALSDLQFRLRTALAEPGVGGRTAATWIPVASAADRLADLVTAYAGQRREGTIAADPISGTELAWEISEAGGAPDRPRTDTSSGQPDTSLMAISESLAHLTALTEPVGEPA